MTTIERWSYLLFLKHLKEIITFFLCLFGSVLLLVATCFWLEHTWWIFLLVAISVLALLGKFAYHGFFLLIILFDWEREFTDRMSKRAAFS
jgi:hypothetical protein